MSAVPQADQVSTVTLNLPIHAKHTRLVTVLLLKKTSQFNNSHETNFHEGTEGGQRKTPYGPHPQTTAINTRASQEGGNNSDRR